MTDTFGTPAFLDAFRKPIPAYTSAGIGAVATTASGASTTTESNIQSEAETKSPMSAPLENNHLDAQPRSYAQVYAGVRQDSGDPYVFAPRAKEIYESMGIDHRLKIIIFSDALNVDKALKLKAQCDTLGFMCEWRHCKRNTRQTCYCQLLLV